MSLIERGDGRAELGMSTFRIFLGGDRPVLVLQSDTFDFYESLAKIVKALSEAKEDIGNSSTR